jgi:hypothetical protein
MSARQIKAGTVQPLGIPKDIVARLTAGVAAIL